MRGGKHNQVWNLAVRPAGAGTPLAVGIMLAFLLIAPRIASGQAPSDSAPELVLQTGHATWVNQVALSPDGRLLASTSDDNTIKLWDVRSGLEIRTLREHTAGIRAVTFSPDGAELAALGQDNVARVWETDTGRERLTLQGGGKVQDVVYDPDGKRLITLSEGRVITYRDAASGETLNRVPAGDSAAPSTFDIISSNGKWVASDGRKYFDDPVELQVWNASSGERVYHHTIQLPGEMRNATLSPDGRLLVSSDEHLAIRICDTTTGTVHVVDPGDPGLTTNRTFSFAFSPDGKTLAVGDESKDTVRILDSATGGVIHRFEKHFAKYLTFSADGLKLAAVRDRSIAIEDPNTGEVLQTLHGYMRSARSIAVSRDGRLLAVGHEDYSVKIWDLSLGKQIHSLGGLLTSRSDSGAAGVALSPDARRVASGDEEVNASGYLDFKISVWNVDSGGAVTSLRGFKFPIGCVSFSPDGRLLAAGDTFGIFKVWDTATWAELNSLDISGEGTTSVISVAFSSDGRWLAFNTFKTIYVWDAATRQLAHTIHPASDRDLPGYEALTFTPDSKRLVVTNRVSHTIDFWDAASGEPGQVIIDHRNVVEQSVAFSPDGRWLAAAGDDHVIRLWDVASGQELRSFTGHSLEVHAVAFMPDGRSLASAGADGSVRIWDASSGANTAVLASISMGKDWVVITPRGLFDGSQGGAQKLVAWRVQNRILAASQYYDSYSTPNLLAQILKGTQPEPTTVLADLRLPPSVRLVLPPGGSTVRQQQVSLGVEAKDEGGGIAEVRLYHNGKLVASRMGPDGSKLQFTFQVTLIPNQENLFKALAVGRDRVESAPDQATLFFEAPAPPKPALYLLVVGINDYQDKSLHLEFAQPDAQALAEFFPMHGNLFSSVNVATLFNQDATKTGIQHALDQLAEKAQPEDVVLVYFAGHGLLAGQQFYFLPQEIKKELDPDASAEKYGISASVLGDALLKVKAVKEVLILDACQSESALSTLAKATFRTRGYEKPEDRAVRMLAHANGIYLIAASAAQESAYEIPELKHGLFTYALLSGLGEHGNPEAMNPDGTVTVLSLINYVTRRVPELTEKYQIAEPQTPVVFDAGTDIPLLTGGQNN